MTRRYRIVSGCSRLDLPPECWTGRVPARWRDRAPRRVNLPTGGDAVIIEDWPVHKVGHTWVKGKSYDPRGSGPSVYERPGTGSPEQRMREQDQDGVDAEIMFTDPHSPVFLGMVASQDCVDAEIMYSHPIFAGFWRGVREDEGYRAFIRAYNEFLAEDYCAAGPSRLIALGVIPDTGVDDAIAELENCARVGLKGVALHRFPSGKGYPTLEDDRFWRAALDVNMPITSIASAETGILIQKAPLFQHLRQSGDSPGEQDPVSLLPRFARDHPIAPLQMAYAGVFDRLPQLCIYWAESQAGWLPDALSQVDDGYQRNRYWGGRSRGVEPMAHPPSFYLRTQCLWGFSNGPHTVRVRHDIGIGQLVWGSGFAHATGDWPRSFHVIERCFAGVPEDERYRMLAGNVIDFFHLKDEVIESDQPVQLAAYGR